MLKAAEAPVLLDQSVICSIAEARGCTAAQVLLAWQLQQGVCVIPKTVTPARIIENIAAEGIELTSADLQQIATLDRGYRFIAGHFWALEGSPWSLELCGIDASGVSLEGADSPAR